MLGVVHFQVGTVDGIGQRVGTVHAANADGGLEVRAARHMMGPWGDVKPFSKLVFIGRNLPEEAIARGLDTCLAKA